jgi:hypothetical protein
MHFLQARISHRHTSLGIHLSQVYISRWHASLSRMLLIHVYLTGVYFTGCAYQGRTSHRVCVTHGRVHLMGVHLWVSLSRVCTSKACIL